MIEFLTFLNETLGSYPVLFISEILSCGIKFYIFIALILQGLRSHKIYTPWFLLLLVLICGLCIDFSWVFWLSKSIFFPALDDRLITFCTRIAWACSIIQYQALGLFLESLIDNNFFITLRHKIFILISSSLSIIFVGFAFLNFNNVFQLKEVVCTFQTISSLYVLIILMPSTLLITFKKIRSFNTPKILRKQFSSVVKFLIIPYLTADFIQLYPFSLTNNYISNYAMIFFSSNILTYAIFYCSHKIMGLRFLNLKSHVQSSNRFNFINDFKDVLEQLSQTTSTKELGIITQNFFKEAFNIPLTKTTLHIRQLDMCPEYNTQQLSESLEALVERFMSRHKHDTCRINSYLQQTHILITDELAFNDFYEETATTKELLQFLTHIHADIFIPIYDQQTITAYIIVERNARAHEFYSNIERDEMLVFASFLGNIIHLLHNRNVHTFIEREKELKEELYNKQQEINQYRESTRSFLRDSKQRNIGIIFYKNRRFIFGNQAAQELINININLQDGHLLTKILKQIAQRVSEYKSPQTCFAKDIYDNQLVISALPSLENNTIIIMVHYPEISDIVKRQIDLLQNPSELDYLLYLETTKTGQIINQLIPGSGEKLLNFKVELLKIALSKKAILLEMSEQDLLPIIEILHHMSLREILETIQISSQTKASDLAIKLFGINQLFGINHEEALLKKLDNVGTLFIQNVDLLDLELQEYLAEFIKYGYYRIFKSDQKVVSNVRIICSTTQNLHILAEENKFSKTLLNELQKTILHFPDLTALPEQELNDLAQGFTEQALKTDTLKSFLELTDKEKTKLVQSGAVSLYEFKEKVQQLLSIKSKKTHIYQEINIHTPYDLSDPDLVHAAQLGKKALKDPHIMRTLWNKFRNQNQIAVLLGVNRSSVNRRCHALKLE